MDSQRIPCSRRNLERTRKLRRMARWCACARAVAAVELAVQESAARRPHTTRGKGGSSHSGNCRDETGTLMGKRLCPEPHHPCAHHCGRHLHPLQVQPMEGTHHTMDSQ